MKNYLKYIKGEEIVCFADNYSEMRDIYGKKIIRISSISDYEFDYIVIFSNKYWKDIFLDLIEYGIDGNKILHWTYYIYKMNYNVKKLAYDSYEPILYCVQKLDLNIALDIDNCLEKSDLNIYSRNAKSLFSQIDYLKSDFSDYDLKKKNTFYDCVFMIDFFMEHDLNDWVNIFHKLKKVTKYFILTIPYIGYRDKEEWSEEDFSQYGNVRIFPLQLVKIVIIKVPYDKTSNCDIEVYAVTHQKPIEIEDDMYVPIYAGKDNNNELGITGDASKVNIACLNRYINECTSLYWIWKNSHTRIVGLVHYRRFLGTGHFWDDWKKDILNREEIRENLKNNDLLVGNVVDVFPLSLKEHLRESLNEKLFDEVFEKIRNRIEIYHSNYLYDFDKCFDGTVMYPCNIMIGEKKIIDLYCEWLFSIIIPITEETDLSKWDDNNSRVIGFIAERLLSVWIRHNGISVKEFPIIYI